MATEQDLPSDTLPLLGAPRRGRAAALGLGVLAALVPCAVLTSPAHRVQLAGLLSSALELAQSGANGSCEGFASLRLLHSNLGNEGPDDGDEGIAYQSKDETPSGETRDLLITINASSTYQAAHPKFNGVHGEFFLITMQAGSEATFTIRVLDPETWKPTKVAKRSFTFFDLDQDANNTSKEYIKVSGYSKYFLTNQTEVNVTNESKGVTAFSSSARGDGSDNPNSPTSLTVEQKHRAVTIEFQDSEEVKVTLGCTAGKHQTYFIFAAVPSLLCATTIGPVADKGEDAAVSFAGPQRSSASPSPQLGRLSVALGLCALRLR